MSTGKPISSLDIVDLNLMIDWGSKKLLSNPQYYIENEPFNFRRAPFSVIQSTDVEPKIRHEFLNMACASGRIDWHSCFANNWHPTFDCARMHELELCFSRFCVITTGLHREMLSTRPVTPDYERGNWYDHDDFRSVERIMDVQDEWVCEPKKILFVAEWRALLYYSTCHIPTEEPFSTVYQPARSEYRKKGHPTNVHWAMSKVIYWPSEGLNRTRLLRCIREKLNVEGKQDVELLCRTAALLGVKIDSRVTQQ